MKIKDMQVNSSIVEPLLVVAATARETKTKKPYLALVFSDGTDSINGNYWDWGGTAIPEANSVLDVTAQVTEWNGAKQLNIKALKRNTTTPISAFIPTSTHDVSEVYDNALALVQQVGDDFLRRLSISILENLAERWCSIPGAKGVHHAYLAGTLIHSYSVATIACAIADKIPGANHDLCLVGGMLHDLGKLFSYTLDGAVIGMTPEGSLLNHTFIGAQFISNYAENVKALTEEDDVKLMLLQHIILSHHGKLEHGAVTVPLSMEAHIVHHADAVDAACEQVRVFSEKATDKMWTDRIWALENRPHLTYQYVNDMMQPSTTIEE